MRLKKDCILFLTGGTAYVVIELIYRQRTHISMFFAGGLSVVLINFFCNIFKPVCKCRLPVKAFIGSGIITSIEYITGLIVNVKMQLNVWDYSHLPYNLGGQICAGFSAAWVLLSVPAIYLGRFVELTRKSNKK